MAKPKIGRIMEAGRGMSPGHRGAGEATVGEILGAVRDELDDVRAKLVAHTQKMDADFADVTNASVDYESSLGLAATAFEK